MSMSSGPNSTVQPIVYQFNFYQNYNINANNVNLPQQAQGNFTPNQQRPMGHFQLNESTEISGGTNESSLIGNMRSREMSSIPQNPPMGFQNELLGVPNFSP